MDINEILLMIKDGVLFLFGTITIIVSVIKAIKNKNWEALKETLTNATIPLMEQAEKMFDNAKEKENWVVKKVGEQEHIDWFKHKNVLALELDIIDDICKTTKIEVNKNIIKQEKEETIIEEKEVLTNGIS